MSTPVKMCAVEGCEKDASVNVGYTVEGKRTNMMICRDCWEDLNFNHVALKFKESEKLSS